MRTHTPTTRRPRPSGNNRGFVLLLVLAAVAVAAGVLGAAARYGCSRALAARAAARDLQLKWGSLSCRAVCLPAADALLRRAAGPDGIVPAAMRRTVGLGGVDFALVISDEQAKADVNVLAFRFGDDVAASHLAALQRGVRRAVQVALRPTPPSSGAISKVPMRYTCPGQVFALAGPDDLVDAAGEGRVLDLVTCWSGGRLNFTRASPEVLAEVTAGLLDDEEIRKLVELRDKTPSSDLAGAMMKALALDPGRRRALGEVLTDQSNCFSLWVVASDGARAVHRLYVDRTGDMENDSMSWGFAWL